MCIIVAKKAKVEMPSMDILETCFCNNPDGAGFMIAAKGSVWGFKGLMTFDEFKAELINAENRFGSLDKLPVVMHFRIGTHGGNTQGNTHPFPCVGSYRELRKHEWKARQGMAHNGIMYELGRDPDVKKFSVSDTMVFVKKFVAPIANYCMIPQDKNIMDILYHTASSKLCFLDCKGNIGTRGNFVEDNGVLYSNESFKAKKIDKDYNWKCFDDKYLYDSYDYKTSNYSSSLILRERGNLEADYGLDPIDDGTVVLFKYASGDNEYDVLDDSFAISANGDLYKFDDVEFDYYLYATADEFEIEKGDEYLESFLRANNPS